MSRDRTCLLETLERRLPDRRIWLLFKVGSHANLAALQNGTLYMNSAAYFARYEADERPGLRGDSDETILARIRGGTEGKYTYKFILKAGSDSDATELDVSDNATMTFELWSPENAMLFCFSALADDDSGRIPGECNGQVSLDHRLLEFGSHILIFRHGAELSSRISKAIAHTPSLYSSRYFQGGYGRVRYIDKESNEEPLGLFVKSKLYEWQREFRLVLGAKNAALNSDGALELRVGNLSDITELIELEPFLKSPLRVERQFLRKVGDNYVEVE